MRQIFECFETNENEENISRWTTRGYLINDGVLYRYPLHHEEEEGEALLVIPKQVQE